MLRLAAAPGCHCRCRLLKLVASAAGWRCAAHAPSVRRALPPVGTHSTVLQLGHTTTVWLWLNTVVLQHRQAGRRSAEQQHGAADQRGKESASIMAGRQAGRLASSRGKSAATLTAIFHKGEMLQKAMF